MKTAVHVLPPYNVSACSMSTRHPGKDHYSKSSSGSTTAASISSQVASTASTSNRSSTESGSGSASHHGRTQPRAEGANSRSSSKSDVRASSNSKSRPTGSSSSSNHSHHHSSTSHHPSSSQRGNHSSSHQHSEQSNHSHHHSESHSRKHSPASTPKIEKSSTEIPLECDWSEHISSSGKPYYFNRKSNSSQWQMPTEFANYRAEKERRLKQKSAMQDRRKTFSSDHRSRYQHQNSSSSVRDVSPPSSSHDRGGNAHHSSGASRTLHRSSTSAHPESRSRSSSSRADSVSVPTTPITPAAVRQTSIPGTTTDNGKPIDSSPVVLQPAMSAQAALHPLQQATLLLQSEQTRKAAASGVSVRANLHNHTAPSPKLACVEYQRMYCDEHNRPRRPRPESLMHPSTIAPVPQLEDALVANYSQSAIAHLQGWPTEAIENEALRAHANWNNISYRKEPNQLEKIHHTQSLCRRLAIASEISAGVVLSIRGHVSELEKSLGLDSNPS
eukprot:scpid58996/ scgid27092/ 